MNEPAPELKQVKAIDAKPYRWAVWCTTKLENGNDSEPFANEIVGRKWSDDGESIWFMLESNNFISAKPNEILSLIELPPYSDEFMEQVDLDDSKNMISRPHEDHSMPDVWPHR